MRTGRSGRMSWLTLISSQFISLIIIALLRLHQLDDALLLLHGCGGCIYELAHTIDVGLVHLHGGSCGSNGSESSLTWWEEKVLSSGRGRQDSVIVSKKKKCRAFKAERHRDENEVTNISACAVRVCVSRD
jgi:hypothetical protein